MAMHPLMCTKKAHTLGGTTSPKAQTASDHEETSQNPNLAIFILTCTLEADVGIPNTIVGDFDTGSWPETWQNLFCGFFCYQSRRSIVQHLLMTLGELCEVLRGRPWRGVTQKGVGKYGERERGSKC